jgi:hypothetical protein
MLSETLKTPKNPAMRPLRLSLLTLNLAYCRQVSPRILHKAFDIKERDRKTVAKQPVIILMTGLDISRIRVTIGI